MTLSGKVVTSVCRVWNGNNGKIYVVVGDEVLA